MEEGFDVDFCCDSSCLGVSSPSNSCTYSSLDSTVSSVVDSIFLTSLTGTPSSTFKSMQSTNL
jgi:hypothetical protein